MGTYPQEEPSGRSMFVCSHVNMSLTKSQGPILLRSLAGVCMTTMFRIAAHQQSLAVVQSVQIV